MVEVLQIHENWTYFAISAGGQLFMAWAKACASKKGKVEAFTILDEVGHEVSFCNGWKKKPKTAEEREAVSLLRKQYEPPYCR